MRVRHELRAEGLAGRFDEASLILQFSSLSSVGNDTRWLDELVQSLCGGDGARPRLCFVFPTRDQARTSRPSRRPLARSPPRPGPGFTTRLLARVEEQPPSLALSSPLSSPSGPRRSSPVSRGGSPAPPSPARPETLTSCARDCVSSRDRAGWRSCAAGTAAAPTALRAWRVAPRRCRTSRRMRASPTTASWPGRSARPTTSRRLRGAS